MNVGETPHPPVTWHSRQGLGCYSVQLEIEAGSGEVLGSATGFFLRDRGAQLLTARHCVTGVHQETAKILGNGGLPSAVRVYLRALDGSAEDVVGCIPLFDEEGRPEWNEHPELGPAADVVALPIGALHRADPATPDLAAAGMRGDIYLLEASPITGFLTRGVVDLAELSKEDRVVVVGFGAAGDDGFPKAVEANLVATREADRSGLPRFQCAGDTGPGFSGSPVFLLSADGEGAALVGMYCGRTPSGHAEFWGRDALAKTALVGVRPTHTQVAGTYQPDMARRVELPLRWSGPPMAIDPERSSQDPS